jgi:hypothetical protein
MIDIKLIDKELLTTDEERTLRINLCKVCENKTVLNTRQVCGKCLCDLELLHFYRFKNCPINKWTT